jgi:hypothetical protein
MKGPRYRRESQVVDVKPLVKSDGSEGYEVMWAESTALFFKKSGKYTSKGIIFSKVY